MTIKTYQLLIAPETRGKERDYTFVIETCMCAIENITWSNRFWNLDKNIEKAQKN